VTGGFRIAPSLLSADFGRLDEAVAACERGGAEFVHFDVMDGHFVPNLTFGPVILRALRRRARIPFDVHLMIEEPLRTLDQYLDAGAARVAVHVEAEPHLHRFAQLVRARGASPGVAINPGTSLAALDEAIRFCDFVLVMSVNPGWGGQSFLPDALVRVRRLSEAIRSQGVSCGIAVDGGVGAGNAGALVAAGAGHLVAGSAVFGSKDVAGAIAELRGAGAAGLESV
jgi:ribulose-phosphate 3-epimerase